MRLSDLFRDMDLGSLGVVALILFFAVFVAILARTLLLRRRDVDRLARLPLDDGDLPAAERRGRSGASGS